MNRKTNVILVFLVALFITISGCGSSKSNSKEIPISQVNQKIQQSTDTSSMRAADATKLKKLYDIDSNELAEFSLLLAPSNIKADEIAVFKVKDPANIQSIKDKITKRVDSQAKSFNAYLPDEYYLIQHNVVKVNGNYVILIIAKDADKISNAVDELFK